MKITQELVEQIARLARQNLSEEEKADMAVRLERILGEVAPSTDLKLEKEPQTQGQNDPSPEVLLEG